MRVLNREIQRLRDNIMTYRLLDTYLYLEINDNGYINRKMYSNPLSLFSTINEANFSTNKLQPSEAPV